MKNLLLLPALLALFLIGAGCLCGSTVPPEKVTASLTAPDLVALDGSFDFTVRLSNSDTRVHHLDSIDIDQSFLKGVYIKSSTPSYGDDQYLGFLDQHTYDFNNLDIPAGSSVDIVFHAKGIESGFYSGNVEPCIDDAAACLRKPVALRVR